MVGDVGGEVTAIELQGFTCPSCRTEFEDWVYTGPSPLGGVTTDFRSLEATSAFYGALLHSCPGCGYLGAVDDFFASVPPEAARLIAERLTPLVGEEKSPQRRFELAAWVAEWRGAPAGSVGDLYHHAAWCCAAGPSSGSDEEAHYRRQAIVWLERALAAGEYSGLQRAVVTYVVGEQHRRVGDRRTAGRWYKQAVALARREPGGENLVTMSKGQQRSPQEVV